MSTLRKMPGGRIDPGELPKGPHGRNLCRWCNLEIGPRRRTFCSEYCVDQWRLRSDPGYLREKVLARDRGVCAVCGTDCVSAWAHIKKLRGPARVKALAVWGLRPGGRKSLWDADHIVPVSRGGGECDLDNLRTLCLRCHRAVTRELTSGMLSAGAVPSQE